MRNAMHLTITGSVQGVFFRTETKRKADELRLSGWVRNCQDGSVEVLAEGKEEALRQLEEWCRIGPPAAQVKAVRREEQDPKNLKNFVVRY